MRSLKNIYVSVFQLILVLSLVSFSGSHYTTTPSEATQIVLVVNTPEADTSFSTQFLNTKHVNSVSTHQYSEVLFLRFHNTVSLKSNTAFKSYTYEAFDVKLKKLHTELYDSHHIKTLYNSIIV